MRFYDRRTTLTRHSMPKYNTCVMRKVIASALALALSSPAYAIGFYVEGNAGMGLFSHGPAYARSEMGGNSSETTYDYTGKANLLGMALSGGVSFAPAPVLLGLGMSFHTGSGQTEGTVGGVKITYEWNSTLMRISVPVAYRMDVAPLTLLLGVAPSYNAMSFTDKDGGDGDTFSGVGVGLFGKGFFKLGPLGVGAGVSLDYVPALTRTKEMTIFDQTVTNTTTLKGNTTLGINLGILFLTGLLE